MASYRTLVVAPETDLPMARDEVQQVVNLLGAKMLTGSQADIQGLLAITAEAFDIIWFATHGDHKGVYLNDNELLSTSEITTIVRSTGAQLTVLNTCSSRPVALGIYDELRVQLVCTITRIPDRTAFVTGTIFARKIAGGLSFREAYEQAKPGQNTSYIFLPEGEPPMFPQPDRTPPRADDISALAEQVRQLLVTVHGSPHYNVDGLTLTVRELVKKVDALSDDFGRMRANQIFNRRLLIFLSIVTLALLIAQSIQVIKVMP